MSVSLLTTKLFAPPPSLGLVARSRLTQRLDEGLGQGRRLSLVVAPAGYGKTTLVTEWLQRADRPFAWLSLDEGDNDPVRFCTYLVAALQTIDPSLGQGLLDSGEAPTPSPQLLLHALINEMASTKRSIILVLDDYHVVAAMPIHEAMTFLLERMPPCLHLVVTTREDPPFPLSRLRVRQALTELRTGDLRFTMEETASFFGSIQHLALAPQQVATLDTRTEGWIAGLQMAALSLQGKQDAEAFVASFSGSHHYIMDYLSEEVLQRQPERVQRFLLQTSVLSRLSGPLCDAVTGMGDGQALLEQLRRTNLFVEALDDERYWYRYHHLFADLLRARLPQLPAESEADLLLRASVWHETLGSLEEAIDYALEAREFERAATLIERHSESMIAQGRLSGLLTWIESLPEEAIVSRPRLGLAHAWVLFFRLRFEDMEARLDRLEQHLTSESASLVRGEVPFLRGVMARLHGDMRRSVVLLEQALAELPARNLRSRGRALIHLGLAHVQDDVGKAQQAYSQARDATEASGSIHGTLAASCFLAWVQTLAGRLRDAEATCERALALVEQAPLLPAAGYAYAAMGTLLYERNELERASEHLHRAVELSELGGNLDVLFRAAQGLARLHRARGEWAEAQRRTAQLARLAPQQSVLIRTDDQLRLWLAQGRLDEAARCVRDNEACFEEGTAFVRTLSPIIQARLSIAQHREEEALSLLLAALNEAESHGMTQLVLQALALQAMALRAAGQIEPARAALMRALGIAEPEGYIRTFVDEGEPLRLLIAGLRSRMPRQAGALNALGYADRLLAAYPVVASDGQAAHALSALAADGVLVEPLSERELELLRLVAAGRSNREIAAELIVAVGTVKKHLNNIFGKLGVRNRTECVARARDLDLV